MLKLQSVREESLVKMFSCCNVITGGFPAEEVLGCGEEELGSCTFVPRATILLSANYIRCIANLLIDCLLAIFDVYCSFADAREVIISKLAKFKCL